MIASRLPLTIVVVLFLSTTLEALPFGERFRSLSAAAARDEASLSVSTFQDTLGTAIDAAATSGLLLDGATKKADWVNKLVSMYNDKIVEKYAKPADKLGLSGFVGSSDEPFVQKAYADTIKRFLDRVQAAKTAKKFATFGALDDFKVVEINVQGSDPHGDLDSVIIFKVTPAHGVTPVKVVYKPSSVDGHFYIQGDHDNSFVHLLNAKMTADGVEQGKLLHKMKVVRESHYGFIEFIERGTFDTSDKTQFETYSYKAGVIAAVAYFCGLDDLHLENVMVSNFEPYLIDAETAFKNDMTFKVESTLLFSGVGAFGVTSVDSLAKQGKDINSPVKFGGKWTTPFATDEFKKSLISGFTDAVNTVVKHNSDFQTWATTNLAAGVYSRYVPIITTSMFEIRRDVLKATAEAITAKTALCEGIMKGTTRVASTFRQAQVAVMSVYENSCEGFIPTKNSAEWYSVPAYWVQVTESKLYYPKLDKTTHFFGILKPSEHAAVYAGLQISDDLKNKLNGAQKSDYVNVFGDSTTGKSCTVHRLTITDKGKALIDEATQLATPNTDKEDMTGIVVSGNLSLKKADAPPTFEEIEWPAT